jgi:Holliday junction resolvasome RuvABC ATP-dependent DNA helicase subunit
MDALVTYHITDVDKMVYYAQHPLHRLTKGRVLFVPEVVGYKKAQKKHFSGLLIISAEKETKPTAELEKHCGAVIQVEDYTDEDIYNILCQRAICGLQIEDKEKVVDAIVQVVNCDVKLCMHLLHWSNKCCRSVGEDIIKLRHLNSALKLLG